MPALNECEGWVWTARMDAWFTDQWLAEDRGAQPVLARLLPDLSVQIDVEVPLPRTDDLLY